MKQCSVDDCLKNSVCRGCRECAREAQRARRTRYRAELKARAWAFAHPDHEASELILGLIASR